MSYLSEKKNKTSVVCDRSKIAASVISASGKTEFVFLKYKVVKVISFYLKRIIV